MDMSPVRALARARRTRAGRATTEFLVRIDIARPVNLSEADWLALREREADRGRDYRAAGTIRRIWRLPGTNSNVGIWAATDPTELHGKLSALPLFPHMAIQVTALADHYLDPQDRQDREEG